MATRRGPVAAVGSREQGRPVAPVLDHVDPAKLRDQLAKRFQQIPLTPCYDQECTSVVTIVARHANPPLGQSAGYGTHCGVWRRPIIRQVTIRQADSPARPAACTRAGPSHARDGSGGARGQRFPLPRLTLLGVAHRVASCPPAVRVRLRTSSPWAISPWTSSREGSAPAARRSTRDSSPISRACASGLLTSYGPDFPFNVLPPEIEIVSVPAAGTTRFALDYLPEGRRLTLKERAARLEPAHLPPHFREAGLAYLCPGGGRGLARSSCARSPDAAVGVGAQGWCRDLGQGRAPWRCGPGPTLARSWRAPRPSSSRATTWRAGRRAPRALPGGPARCPDLRRAGARSSS